jgi:signal transduction histidine kinase
VTNAVTHSGSQEVTVTIVTAGGELRIDVTDRGVGFDPESVTDTRKVGLISIHERLRGVAGTCEVNSRPGAGTSLRARVPLRLRSLPTEVGA